MQALTQNDYRTKIQKEFIWLITILLMIAGLPLLKNILVTILVKLYELLIQRAQWMTIKYIVKKILWENMK